MIRRTDEIDGCPPPEGAGQGPLVFFQYGDFAEACRRFDEGGVETFLDQRKSVDFVRDLSSGEPVIVVSLSDAAYDTAISPGLRAIGLTRERFLSKGIGTSIVEEFGPGKMIVRTPHIGVLSASTASRVPTLASFADVMFPVHPRGLIARSGVRTLRNNWRLRKILAAPSIACVGNHSRAAAVSLRDVLGVHPTRIVPWEWSRVVPRGLVSEKPSDGNFEIFFAGAIVDAKGVGDLFDAFGLLWEQNHNMSLRIAGDGSDRTDLEERVRNAEFSSRIDFLGRISNSDIVSEMAKADAVVVPSRHAYAEGLPNVIYEALGARAPLVISDHPSFAGRFEDQKDCLIFRAGDPVHLAEKLRHLIESPNLRDRISERSADVLDRLYFGTSWYDLMGCFVKDPNNRTNWVQPRSLAALETGDRSSGEDTRPTLDRSESWPHPART